MLTTICFDADDTLWHNERYFRLTQDRFSDLLADYAAPEMLGERLLQAEKRNIGHYGYGIKGFTLSMIETALEVTENRVPGEVIAELVAAGQDMLQHPIELLPGVEDTIRPLAERHSLVLVTKGDLLHQERKLAQSGLGDFFDGVEIVSEKTVETYRGIFQDRAIQAEASLMVGNSIKSDVNPAIEAGAWGIYVPHGVSWELEKAEPLKNHPRYREIPSFSDLSETVKDISRNI